MTVGEFNSFITIEKGRYSKFQAVFISSTGQEYMISDISSTLLVSSSLCGESTEEKLLFLAVGLSGAFLSADRLADILAATPDDYEMEFVNNVPGIPPVTSNLFIEDAFLDDLTTSSVGSGDTVTGKLTLSDVPPTPCSSSSSSS